MVEPIAEEAIGPVSDVARVGMEDLFAGGGEMGERMRMLDWSRTPLGPVSSWTQALRTTVGLLVRNRFPLILWWGHQFVQFYNDAYIPIPGEKHPRALGQPANECWAEIWHVIGPMIEAPFAGLPATWSDDLFLLIERRGFLEETHFKVAYSPVPDDAVPITHVAGVLVTVAETTEQIYGERQLKTLRALGSRAAEAKTAHAACETAAATFTDNPWDVPFALFYLIDPDGKRARLAASTGFEAANGPTSPAFIDLAQPPEESAWPIARIIETRLAKVLTDLKARGELLPSGKWDECPGCALALPLCSPDHQLHSRSGTRFRIRASARHPQARGAPSRR